MKHLPPLICATCLLVAATAAVAQPSTPPPTFLEALGVRLVNVGALVTDKTGRPIVDLERSDFELREDGKKVEITHFEGPRVVEAGTAESKRVEGWVVILIDNFGISPLSKQRVLASARDYVTSNLGSGLRFAVASYDGYLQVRQTFTEDEALLVAALDGLEELDALGLARRSERWADLRDSFETLRAIHSLTLDPAREDDVPRHLNSYVSTVQSYAERVRHQTSSVFYALSHMVNALGALPGRKALVFVSEGQPMRPGEEFLQAGLGQLGDLPQTSRTGEEARQAAINQRSAQLGALSDMGTVATHGRVSENNQGPPGLQQLTATATSNRVSIYSLKADGFSGGLPAEFAGDTAGVFTPAIQSVRDRNLLETLQVMAGQTGGEARVGAGLDGLLERASADLGQQYSLAFAPERPADGRYHELKLKVKRKGARVRSRAGYIDKTVGAKLADRATTSLLLGIDDNPHGVRLEVGQTRPAGKKDQVEVALVVHIPLGDLVLSSRDGFYEAETQLFLAARDSQGDMAPVQALGLRIETDRSLAEDPDQVFSGQLPLLLRKGTQRIGLAFVDPQTGSASFVSLDLDLAS